MKHNVLITRPIDQSERFASEVKALGAEPIVCPLTTIERLPFELEKSQSVEAYIVTSIHGIPLHLSDQQRNTPLYIVGEVAAAQAKASGFKNIVTIAMNSAALLSSLFVSPYRDFIYWRGVDVSFDFTKNLPTKNIQEKIIYAAREVQYLDAGIVKQFEAIGTVTLFSARAARIFSDLAKNADISRFFPQINLLCLSPAVLESVSYKVWRSINIAPQPSQAAMLEALKDILQVENDKRSS